MYEKRSIWIGYDPSEKESWEITRFSILRRLQEAIPVHKLTLVDLQTRGLYHRPTEFVDGRMIDVLSKQRSPLNGEVTYDGRCSTEHALARFWVPMIAGSGWALFMDGDILVRKDLAKVFERLDPDKAVYVVKHLYHPKGALKKDGDLQTRYFRKNWSSFMIFNCDHPANKWLSLLTLNAHPGRDLHSFFWLNENEIGELDPQWNWLVNHSDPNIDPAVVHFTEGLPNLPGFENVPYADEWRTYANFLQPVKVC